MIYDETNLNLEQLSPEKLRQIARAVERIANQKSPVFRKATGGRKRILELQLRAFKRLPSRILEEYMTEDEKSEYYGLVDSYS
jgi:hypothetical protein